MKTYLLNFFLLLVFALSSAKEIHLECDPNHDVGNECNVKELETFGNGTKLVFNNLDNKIYTKVIFMNTNPVFVDQVIKLFPHATGITIYAANMSIIYDYSFADGSKIEELILPKNQLTEITQHTFSGAENLKTLDLAMNHISHVHRNAFETNPKLEFLNLERNALETIDAEVFTPLKNLKSLFLNSNHFTNLDPKLVAHNDKLEFLSLGENKFGTKFELELNSKVLKKIDLRTMELENLVLR